MENLINQIAMFFGMQMSAEAEKARKAEREKKLATVLKFRLKEKEAPRKRSSLH